MAFGCLSIALAAVMWIPIADQYSYMAKLADLVTRRGVMYREEFVQDLQMLTSQVHVLETLSLVLLLSGVFCLAMSFSAPTNRTKTALAIAPISTDPADRSVRSSARRSKHLKDFCML